MTGELIHGEVPDALSELDDNSVHAIVTDPPYGLGFMGRSWDEFGPKEYQKFCEQWAKPLLRVLKPGGHLLAFSGTRTFHRLICGIEDAGWTMRDTLAFMYGNGFPKGTDLSKHIDRYHGAEDERKVVGHYKNPDGTTRAFEKMSHGYDKKKSDLGVQSENFSDGSDRATTEAATTEAAKFEGWNTQMKPAFEPISMFRAPLSESAIYRNALEHGTGGLNIDGCRVGTETYSYTRSGIPQLSPRDTDTIDKDIGSVGVGRYKNDPDGQKIERSGRYPANVVLDQEAARLLDEQTGDVSGGDHRGSCDGSRPGGFVDTGSLSGDDEPNSRVFADTGGASRFYYTSKASTAERTHNGTVENDFPTVKPLDLMQWLVRLVTKEGWTVLDPFCGSGTTALACELEGREWVAIDADEDTLALAQDRLDHIGDLPDEYLNKALC